jgi:hypothetical protein
VNLPYSLSVRAFMFNGSTRSAKHRANPQDRSAINEKQNNSISL